MRDAPIADDRQAAARNPIRAVLRVAAAALGAADFSVAVAVVAALLAIVGCFEAMRGYGWIERLLVAGILAVPCYLIAAGFGAVIAETLGRGPPPPVESDRYWLARVTFDAADALPVSRRGERIEGAPVYDALDLERHSEALALRLVNAGGLAVPDPYPLLLPRNPAALRAVARALDAVAVAEETRPPSSPVEEGRR